MEFVYKNNVFLFINQPTLGVQRPTNALLFVILSPVGPYFSSGFKPVSLLADPEFVRAWPGGCGMMKMGSNYGPTLAIQVSKLQDHYFIGCIIIYFVLMITFSF